MYILYLYPNQSKLNSLEETLHRCKDIEMSLTSTRTWNDNPYIGGTELARVCLLEKKEDTTRHLLDMSYNVIECYITHRNHIGTMYGIYANSIHGSYGLYNVNDLQCDTVGIFVPIDHQDWRRKLVLAGCPSCRKESRNCGAGPHKQAADCLTPAKIGTKPC